MESDKVLESLNISIGRYSSRWRQIRYRGILSRRIGIDKGGGWIRFGDILSSRIGIDACGGVCIRFRDNRSRMIGRDGNVNRWVRLAGTVVVVGRSVGSIIVVVVVETGAKITGVELLAGTLVE